MRRRALAIIWGGLAAASWACAPLAGPNGGPAPRASTTRAPASLPTPNPPAASPDRQGLELASPKAPTATPSLILPLRLGLALPGSVVGAEASRLLKGEASGLVAPPLATLVADAQGRIVSNNSGSLVANHGAGLISDQGGGLIANHGASRRLMALSFTEEIATDPRTELWFLLAFVDHLDQILQGYGRSGAQLGRWSRFQLSDSVLLPPPLGAEVFALATAQMQQSIRAAHLAGIAHLVDGRLRLQLVVLPKEGASVAEGQALAELSTEPSGEGVARIHLPDYFLSAFGLKACGMRLALSPSGAFEGSTGEDYLAPEARGPLAKAINGERRLIAIHRRVRISPPEGGRMQLLTARAERLDQPVIAQVRSLIAFGFAPPARPDLGLASYHRLSEGPEGPRPPFQWQALDKRKSPGEGPMVVRFQGPLGEAIASPSPDLAALVPSFGPEAEAFLPELPATEASAAGAPSFAIPPLSEALKSAPGGQAP